MDYPAFARSERIADALVHALAVTLALCGTILLIVLASPRLGGSRVAALSIYGGAMSFSFIASLFYHFTPWERLRPSLQRLDHAAIYVKIAGTYTPLVVMLGSVFGYVVLAVVWVLALIGAAAKLFFWRAAGRYSTTLYLLLGWMSLLLALSLMQVLPMTALILIGLGGALYTAGTLFFSWEDLKYAMAIWHGFVLAGSGCFFAAISIGAFAA
ncbi:MAG: hemolysin III [Limimaricola sp.]|uniref:PAQR family membrane homeostasis protein TrhA n=1 Tax=Limimaricola sp. TaxID=2211665 RepID=UPI001DDD0127|nr:hemolysin III family protein [Limimaricola sp.]MBI1415852.1 hemolysin III [Limimaricola sp.]